MREQRMNELGREGSQFVGVDPTGSRFIYKRASGTVRIALHGATAAHEHTATSAVHGLSDAELLELASADEGERTNQPD
jgi:hypothetical protein